jgi:aspartate 1-decarboxylase
MRLGPELSHGLNILNGRRAITCVIQNSPDSAMIRTHGVSSKSMAPEDDVRVTRVYQWRR